MFEKVIPAPRDSSGTVVDANRGGELLIGNVAAAPVGEGGGGALRAIEWNELTARLKAAHDLRALMRRDSRFNIQSTASSFGDAAATYFRTVENDERLINPSALEHCKASSDIESELTDDAATGDARDY